MPAKMEPHQLAFWRELLAPFADHELSEVPARGGKKVLTYIDKRALENRLDSVCGPDGWYPEYEATARGYKCRLFLRVPGRTPGTEFFMHKEDGAGFEEMGSYNKQTNEWEADVDNDEKSGYTNALRRAAQDAWGIGRYLYRKGIPAFLDPSARPAEPAPQPQADRQQSERERINRDHARHPEPAAQPQPQPEPARSAGNSVSAPPGLFKVPRPGKGVFGWAKDLEKVFETRIANGMAQDGEKLGYGKTMTEWTAEQVREIAMRAIEFIRTVPTYKGQFDHLFDGQPGPKTEDEPPPGRQGVNLADLRRDVMTKLQALVSRQIGRPAEKNELREAFGKIAPRCTTGEGRTGEAAESLATMTDATWIGNIAAFLDDQIAQSVRQGDQEDDDIPF